MATLRAMIWPTSRFGRWAVGTAAASAVGLLAGAVVPERVGWSRIGMAGASAGMALGLADALSLLFVIREDKPVLYDKAAVRWFAKYAAEDRYLLLRDARELIDLLDGIGRHDRVAVVRLERWLRARGYDDEADRVA